MLRTRTAVRLLSAGAAVLAAACADGPEPVAPGPPEVVLQPPEAQARGSLQSALARAVPGFGGFFLARGRVPTVYLTDPSARVAAERALAPYMRELGVALGALEVRPAAYSYRRLDDWYGRATPEVLAVPGVAFIDLDESENRLVVGIFERAAAAAVRAVVDRLGIPADAVSIEATEPIRFVATLRDLVRPTVAGLQINFSNFVCSIGFNALDGGQASFVTASHCTDQQGGVEGTEYFQPLASVANSFIGTEVEDPTYFRGGVCPRGKRCRYSDAARAAYASGVGSDLGGIAKTDPGSLTITGTFDVTADASGDPVVGETVSKVGRTTGLTTGQVTRTCVNTAVQGTNIALLCQAFVEGAGTIVAGGDSGSGVFKQGGTNSVTLYGILWGGNSSGTLFVYSPLYRVKQELGSLTTH